MKPYKAPAEKPYTAKSKQKSNVGQSSAFHLNSYVYSVCDVVNKNMSTVGS